MFKKIWKKYWHTGLIIIIISFLFIDFRQETRTDGISISSDYNQLKCAKNIKITHAKNAYTYLEKNSATHQKNIICSLDKSFSGSDQDRITLLHYSIQKLEFWAFNRWDIAQYFYKKIINSNPDDSLSLYIKKYKIRDGSLNPIKIDQS